ncbi:MAG: ArsA-related P-loop ATPase [Haliangium ochraceum]
MLDLRFIVLSGKGGVGRTTVAAALARAAAARGRRVLIAQADAVERLGPMLGHAGPIGSTVVTVAPGIDAVNMTPKESLHQYALMVLRYETLYRALFENRAVRGFLSAIPGLDAYAMLGKVWWHTTETEDTRGAAARDRAGEAKNARGAMGRPRYDLVILDGPASGHTATMLKIPQAILDTTPTGPLVKDTTALRELLSDRARSALVIVTLPEELPAIETRELAATATRELGIGLGPLIVNAMPPERLSRPPVAGVLDQLASARQSGGGGELAALLDVAEGVRARRQAADAIVTSLGANPGLPIIQLPWLPAVALGPREIDALAAVLGQQLTSRPAPNEASGS